MAVGTIVHQGILVMTIPVAAVMAAVLVPMITLILLPVATRAADSLPVQEEDQGTITIINC